MNKDDFGRVVPTGLSSTTEPQERLGPAGFDPSRMIELAERCEKATGLDLEAPNRRALSNEIGRAVGATFAFGHAPDYLASLDAAMTLVPTQPVPNIRPGTWWWSVDSLGCDAHVAYENHDSGILEESASAATPPLALTAAALRARAASAIEARQGQDPKGLDAKHESAVPKGDAHD